MFNNWLIKRGEGVKNGIKENDYFNTLHQPPVHKSWTRLALSCHSSLFSGRGMLSPVVHLWVMSEPLPLSTGESRNSLERGNHTLGTTKASRLSVPFIPCPLIPRSSCLKYFLLLSSHILGDNLASYFTEMIDASPLIFFTFSYLH